METKKQISQHLIKMIRTRKKRIVNGKRISRLEINDVFQ